MSGLTLYSSIDMNSAHFIMFLHMVARALLQDGSQSLSQSLQAS
jgi:hypothetical protein